MTAGVELFAVAAAVVHSSLDEVMAEVEATFHQQLDSCCRMESAVCQLLMACSKLESLAEPDCLTQVDASGGLEIGMACLIGIAAGNSAKPSRLHFAGGSTCSGGY